jgi:hypothetical protein
MRSGFPRLSSGRSRRPGCSSTEQQRPCGFRAAPAPKAKAEAPIEGAKPQSGSEWEELLNKLKANYAVTEQQKSVAGGRALPPGRALLPGRRLREVAAGVPEGAAAEPEPRALKALFTEVAFILGQGKATPQTVEYDKS